MCKCAHLTMDREVKYFYIDERAKPADGQPSFRLTFYNFPPEGMTAYPEEGMSVFTQGGADDPRFDLDFRSMVVEAEAFDEACQLFYQHLE